MLRQVVAAPLLFAVCLISFNSAEAQSSFAPADPIRTCDIPVAESNSSIPFLDTTWGGHGREACQIEPCSGAYIDCLDPCELKEVCAGEHATACSNAFMCTISISEESCRALGIVSGRRRDIGELVRWINSPTQILSLSGVLNLCELSHEIEHLLNPCGPSSCQGHGESIGYTEQARCLSAFHAEKCGAPPAFGWSAAECNELQEEICVNEEAASFSACRCTHGTGQIREACPGCYEQCKASSVRCGLSSTTPEEMCGRLNENYCDGRTLPTPTPTPQATPSGCAPKGGTSDFTNHSGCKIVK